MRPLDVRAATLSLFALLGWGLAIVLQRYEMFHNPVLAPVCTQSIAIALAILWLNRSSLLTRQLRHQKKNSSLIENLLDVHVRRYFTPPVLVPPILYLTKGMLFRVFSGGYTGCTGEHIRKVLAGSEWLNAPGGLILFGIGIVVSDKLESAPAVTTANCIGIPLILYAFGCISHLYVQNRRVHSGWHKIVWSRWKSDKWITPSHYKELMRNAAMWEESMVGGAGTSRNLSIRVECHRRHQVFSTNRVVYASQLTRIRLTSSCQISELEVVPKFPGLGASVTALVYDAGKNSRTARSVRLGPGLNSKEFQDVLGLHLRSQRDHLRLLAFLISEDVHGRSKLKPEYIRDDVVFDNV